MTVLEQETIESVIDLNRKVPEITLRDLFAMSVMSGLEANGNCNCYNAQELAEMAYCHADAMLKARGSK